MKKTTILTDAPRRRKFSDDLKASILSEMADPDKTVAEIARRYEVSQALLYNWRRAAVKQSSFIRIVPSAGVSPQSTAPTSLPAARISSPAGVIIEFASSITLDEIVYLATRLGSRS